MKTSPVTIYSTELWLHTLYCRVSTAQKSGIIHRENMQSISDESHITSYHNATLKTSENMNQK